MEVYGFRIIPVGENHPGYLQFLVDSSSNFSFHAVGTNSILYSFETITTTSYSGAVADSTEINGWTTLTLFDDGEIIQTPVTPEAS